MKVLTFERVMDKYGHVFSSSKINVLKRFVKTVRHASFSTFSCIVMDTKYCTGQFFYLTFLKWPVILSICFMQKKIHLFVYYYLFITKAARINDPKKCVMYLVMKINPCGRQAFSITFGSALVTQTLMDYPHESNLACTKKRAI